MQDTQIIEKALEEVIDKNFAVTKQYLEVHELVFADGKPKIDRVDMDRNDGTAIVYFPLKDQRFHLAVYLDISPLVAVRSVETEPYSSVYFRATSDTLDVKDITSMTHLASTGGWNKGDKRRFGDSCYSFSSVEFMPNPEPDAFEYKLKKLLDFLEQDKAGVKKIVNLAKGYIQVAMIFHNGNTMLGGPHLDKDLIRRMSELNLEIDFDLYAEGKSFVS